MDGPQFTLAHIGINPNGDDAARIASLFCAILDEPRKDGNSSIFAGSKVEVMRENYLGKNGHIAFATEDVDAAVQWLTEKGFTFDAATEKRDADGACKAVYLTGDFGGFAVHLLKR